MTGLCGWAGLAHANDEARAIVERMAVPLLRRDDSCAQYAINEMSSLAVAAVSTKRELHQEGATIAAIYGKPRSSDARAPELGCGLARYLLECYRDEGIEFLRTLSGPFSLVLVLDQGREALLAIDRMGICALMYSLTRQGMVFGSTADVLNSYSGAPPIDQQSLFNYIYFHMVPSPSGIFRDQHRVAPGSYVRYRRDRVETGAYWKMRYEENVSRDFGELKEEFRSLLRKSVSQAVDGGTTGTFLSGGTDSSTVAGILTEVSEKPANTYSIGFDVPDYDEIRYARIAAKHFGTAHHEYFVTPNDVLGFIPRLASFCDQPFGNASAVPTYYCASLARSDGVDTLLGGDGGDELFGGNERYAMQTIFSWYGAVPELLREGFIEPLLAALPVTHRVPLLRKAKSYVSQAMVPMPDRLHSYNVLNRNPLEQVFVADFLASVDASRPLSLFRDAYHNADAGSMLNRMLALDLQFTVADIDLYKVNKMCELANVRPAYPMLNDELVTFSATLPTHLKLKGIKLRYFFKEALSDFLPKEIINKRKHGFGLPVGIWMRSYKPLQDLAYSAMDAFKARKILRPEFIDQLVRSHCSGSAAYYGGEIWVLMMLELWLQAHAQARGTGVG